MEVTQFFRCMTCGRAFEMGEFLKKQKSRCPCGNRRFVETILSKWEVVRYLLTHPSVLWETAKYKIRGE